MQRWFQRFTVFAFITALIVGGLGWATFEALRIEDQQRREQAQKERTEKLRRALWRLDGMVSPHLARENGRPFAHFSSLHAPIPAMTNQGVYIPPGNVRVPSPLLDVDLPPWMLLHFQYAPGNKEGFRWQSPQVLPIREREYLRQNPFNLALINVTPEREEFLMGLPRRYSGDQLLEEVRQRIGLSQEFREPTVGSKIDGVANRLEQNNLQNDGQRNNWNEYQAVPQSQVPKQQATDTDNILRGRASNTSRFNPRAGKEVDPGFNLDSITAAKNVTCDVGDVLLTAMTPLWFPSSEKPEHLFFIRLARYGQRDLVQGVIIDWAQLKDELRKIVVDLFPDARLNALPVGADPDAEGVMSSLPLQLDPGPQAELPSAGWTPLRVGLGVAWAAILTALLAIGITGWSLIDLSERRIRFVSAVTHELRTPLTTLRLYLDMLTNGLVRDETQKEEYLKTLNSESERLHRLISNVLDFARLEKQAAKPSLVAAPVDDLLEQTRGTWHERCEANGKLLVVENHLPTGLSVQTDTVLAQQILGNLIDNACKYSKCASDKRVWLRATPVGNGAVAIEVEDCGLGVDRRDGRSIFRPFRRGRDADTTAGGVGLGLALAKRWAAMLGGKIDVRRGDIGGGACFRLELPKA